MCSDPDSQPPIEAPAEASVGQRLTLATGDGNGCAAFRADALEPTGAGIIVLPDYHGLTGFYEALTLRFAETGVDAIAIDYYGRTADPPPREAPFEHVRHAQRTTWLGLQADVAAAAAELRTTRSIESLFSIGFCFGGRTSFLLGTLAHLDLAGVIGFYGWPVGAFLNDTPAPADVAGDLRSAVLAVFGGADPKIASGDVRVFDSALAASAVEYAIHSYEGAPHSFFDRAYPAHAAAAGEAWAEVRGFIASHHRQRR